MNQALLRTADKLALALKQMEQARRNLRRVQIWADKHNQIHLGQGTLDLIQGVVKLSADLQSLVCVVRARASDDVHPAA